MFSLSKITDIKMDGIDNKDYPSYCNAYISEAYYNGKPMTEKQLDKLNDNYRDFVYEQTIKWVF